MSQYHPSIPQASDDPSDSQQDLLDNFGQLNTQISVNHVPLVGSQTPGFHTQLWFPNGPGYTVDPNLAAPQASLYPKTATSNTVELFYQNTNTFAGVSQLTNLPIVNGIITNVVPGPPTIITSPYHGLSNGDTIQINGLYGSTQLNYATNGSMQYTVSNVTNPTLVNGTFQVTQSGVDAYIGGGYWVQTNITNTRYGFRSPWGLTFNFGTSTTPSSQTYAIPYNTTNYLTEVTGITSTNAGITAPPSLSSFSWTAATAGSPPPPPVVYYFSFGV